MRLIASIAAGAALLLIGSLLPVAHSEGVPPIFVTSDAVCKDAGQSVGHMIHDALVHYPDIIIKKFVGAEAQAGIEIYNTLPPPGKDVGDTFYVAFNPHSPDAWVSITQGDCVVNNMMVPVPVAIAIVKRIAKGLPGA